MKKITTIIVCLFAFSILALANNVSAYNTSYTQTDYNGSTMPTLDGRYTTNDEYSAGAALGFGTNAVFRDFWTSSSGVYENFIFETMDTTNDAGDQYVICYDSNPDGGTSPKTDDFKIVITGHGTSATVQWYRGTGSAWSAVTGPTAPAFDFKESLATSPTSSTPHYMVEAKIDKQSTDPFGIVVLGMNFAMRLSYTDASTSTVQAWPPAPASNDVPDGWGYVPYSMDPVPESLNIGIVLALSSAAVIAGVIIVRKPKTLALKINHQ